jgi:hypothetical protein
VTARHRAPGPPRRARIWATVAVLCAALGIGALLPAPRPGGIGGPTGLRLAPAITAAGGRGAAAPTSQPVRVAIPSLHVDAPVVPVGLLDDGSMEMPAVTTVGWYEHSPSPGETGPAVLVGHVDWAGRPGVFHDLGGLSPGDGVTVTREDGTNRRFRVDRVAIYPKNSLPTDAVFGNLDHPGLRLITCGGPFDPSAGEYPDNVVAFASPEPSA